jgi:hypothetical protein
MFVWVGYTLLTRSDCCGEQEIRAYEDARDRRHLENLADLYAIIKATEHLEIAYGRDAISPDEVRCLCHYRVLFRYDRAVDSWVYCKSNSTATRAAG